jgi:two-component system phosphate regulon sensor histidine kinase PhoR
VIECEDAVIYQHDEHAGVLRVMAGIGPRLNAMHGTVVSLQDERSMAAWVANRRRARVYAPVDEDVGAVTEALVSGEEMSLLCVPLVSKERLQGVIMLSRKEVFRPQELGAMLNLSNTIAATLENVYLYQRARAEREQQAALYAFASDAIVVIDDTLSIIEANIAFATLLGRPLGAILGSRICDLLHFRQSACMLCGMSSCLLKHALETETLYPHVECTLPLTLTEHPQTGGSTVEPTELHYIDFSITPVTSTGQRRLLLVGRDVSLFRQFDTMKANFLSTVAHELRGPLQALNGNLDKLLDLCEKPGDVLPHHEVVRSLRRARAGGETLSALVADLLMIWRLDAGQFHLNLEDADLIAVIENAVYELELLAEQQKVSLVLDLPETIPLVKADSIRIEQVLRNLLTNGIKFTPPGGSVTVSAQVFPDAIEIRVSDTGIGITPEHQRRIFDRFYQVKSVSHDVQRLHGQGLGLSVVQSIVASHGGSVEVASAPQHGSTFTVRLSR